MARDWFLFGMATVYMFAFSSLYTQVPGELTAARRRMKILWYELCLLYARWSVRVLLWTDCYCRVEARVKQLKQVLCSVPGVNNANSESNEEKGKGSDPYII